MTTSPLCRALSVPISQSPDLGDDKHQAKTKANGIGDSHQAGTGAGDKGNGSGNDGHQAGTKANGGGLHQAKNGTKDNSKFKIKTETEGSKGSGNNRHQAGIKANGGGLHQAKTGTKDNTRPRPGPRITPRPRSRKRPGARGEEGDRGEGKAEECYHRRPS